MGKKRRHREQCSDEEIRKELRKLKKKLKRRRHRSRSPSSETTSESQYHVHAFVDESEPEIIRNESEDSINEENASVMHSVVIPQPYTNTDLMPSTSKQLPSEENKDDSADFTEVIPLDDDILTLLGDAPQHDLPIGKDVHADIASRLEDILKNGLKKEIKDKLKEEYPIPGNCQLFKAPVLNAEIKAAITDVLQKKDSSIASRQDQIGLALAALTKALEILVVNKSETNQLLVKYISDASRLLCDSHHIDTRMRRNFLISTLNSKLKDTLKETKRDKDLFGETLPEKLKATKAISRTSLDLRTQRPKPTSSNKGNFTPSTSRTLNWRHPQPNNPNRKTAMTAPRTAGSGSYRNETQRSETARRPAAAATAATTGVTCSNRCSLQELQEDLNQVSSQSAQKPYPRCSSFIREVLLRKYIPPSSLNIMTNSLSQNSLNQYNCYFKEWYNHCLANNCDYLNASVQKVIYFLTELYDSGYQYGSLNCCKSALAFILDNNVMNDSRIQRFMKGVFRLRPPKPKYDVTWNTDLVFNYFIGLDRNEELSLELLSKKLITLLALITAHRVQTLSKIQLKNIIIRSDLILIKISEAIKTTRPNCNQPILKLPFYCDKPELCPAKTLICYMNRTSSIRKSSNESDYLFISFRRPYSAVSSQTLSRWIKDVLHRSGVDTNIFGSHSTRHASTSKAKALGVSVDLIRKTAGWTTSSSVFVKFYNREILTNIDQSFALSILSNSNGSN